MLDLFAVGVLSHCVLVAVDLPVRLHCFAVALLCSVCCSVVFQFGLGLLCFCYVCAYFGCVAVCMCLIIICCVFAVGDAVARAIFVSWLCLAVACPLCLLFMCCALRLMCC